MTRQDAIKTAIASGRRAGKARKQGDESRAQEERHWFNRFRPTAIMPGLCAGELEVAYAEGYAEETRRSAADVRALNYGI